LSNVEKLVHVGYDWLTALGAIHLSFGHLILQEILSL